MPLVAVASLSTPQQLRPLLLAPLNSRCAVVLLPIEFEMFLVLVVQPTATRRPCAYIFQRHFAHRFAGGNCPPSLPLYATLSTLGCAVAWLRLARQAFISFSLNMWEFGISCVGILLTVFPKITLSAGMFTRVQQDASVRRPTLPRFV